MPRRRGNSFSYIPIPSQETSKVKKITTYPFTKKERLRLESAMQLSDKHENIYQGTSADKGILSFDQLAAELDEIDAANDYEYVKFREITQMHLYSCSQMISQSNIVLDFIGQLEAGFSSVDKETSSLQEKCNSLLQEQTKISELRQNVDKNLEIFNNLEDITKQLNAPGSSIVIKDSFPDLLDKLDEGLKYVEVHKDFKDIDRYQQRFRHCMTRALSLIQVYFQDVLKRLANDIQEQSTKITNSSAISALIYSKFEAESVQLSKLTNEISKRIQSHTEYEGLLNDCMRSYFAVRLRIITPKINKELEESIKDPRDIVQFSRSLLAFYKEICTQEYELCQKIFGASDEYCMEWISDLCSYLYDAIRQRTIREPDIGLLCELASLLLSYKEDEDLEDIDENEQRWDGSSVHPLSPANKYASSASVSNFQNGLGDSFGHDQKNHINFFTLFQPILQDVQARLLFRVQQYVDQEIVRHVPTEEDLHGLSGRRKKKQPNATVKNSFIENESAFNVDNIFGAWYPPMRKAISLLSQINQLVNSVTFDDMAHRIVHECLVSLDLAHKLAVSRLGKLEADLFLIKHLLILRNQILEFDIEYVPSNVHIDFSGISEVLSLVRQEGISSLQTQNLLNLAKITVPKVVENMFDAKDELYAKLRNTIHSFTEEAVKLIINSIVGPVGPSTAAGTKGNSGLPVKTPKTALEDTRQLRENATNEIPRLRKMMLENYIDDTRTVDILIDSIQDLVIQAYEKYHKEIVDIVNKERSQQNSDENPIDGLMEVEGLIAWFGDIVGDMHKDQSNVDGESRENETVISE